MDATKAEFALLIYDLSHIANENGVRVNDLATVLNMFGANNSLDGKKTLLALYGAEHLDSEGAAMLSKRKVVLLANQRTSAMKASIDRTIWAPALTPKVMEVSLGLLCPRAQPQSIIRAVKVAGGDLRQAQLHLPLTGNTPTKAGTFGLA